MRKILLPKLGLHDTYLAVPDRHASRYAQGYDKSGQPIRLSPGALADEAYGIKSTSADLIRFVGINLGEVAVEPALAQALTQTRIGQYRVGPMTQAMVWERYAYPVALADLLAGNSADMALGTHEADPLESPKEAPEVWVNKTGFNQRLSVRMWR